MTDLGQTKPPAYDLAVAYRIYPCVSKVPPVFGDDKLRLARMCLKSFKAALGGLKAKVFVILDGCPSAYARMFKEHFDAEDLELIQVRSEGNLATFGRQIDLLLNQDAAEFVYFAEDDYFYFPGALVKMLAFMKENRNADFVTAYDHGDYYTSALQRTGGAKLEFESIKWRSVCSTCLTFLTKKSVLREAAPVLRSYCRKNPDTGVWIALTHIDGTGTLKSLLRVCPDVKSVFYIAAAWWFFPGRMAAKKRFVLWAPVPTLAAHMESDYLPPKYDWGKILEEAASDC
ncbi:MAG: glycosyltransferase family 2 protein [Verrucomicrobia bacterium]|nr:glycosyltransferase family 2 protein [Verrucomicrobiota bacterium]